MHHTTQPSKSGAMEFWFESTENPIGSIKVRPPTIVVNGGSDIIPINGRK